MGLVCGLQHLKCQVTQAIIFLRLSVFSKVLSWTLNGFGGNTEVQSGPELLRERAYLEASVLLASLKCEVIVGKMVLGTANSSSCNMEIFSPLPSLKKG